MSPALGETLPGWNAPIRFDVRGAETWEIQVANDQSFAPSAIVAIQDAIPFAVSADGSVRTLGADVALTSAVSSTFFWRVRAKSDKPWPLASCLQGNWFNVDAQIQIITPSNFDGGYYHARPDGMFAIARVAGAAYYSFTFSASAPAGCVDTPASRVFDDIHQPWPGQGVPTVPVTMAEMNPTLYAARSPDPNTTYYLAVGAAGPDGVLGTCRIVPFRMRQLAAPVLVYPKDNHDLSSNLPSNFVFRAVDGATLYRLLVIARGNQIVYLETRTPSELLSSVFSDHINHDWVINQPGLFTWEVPYTWQITAEDGEGAQTVSATNPFHLGATAPVLTSPGNMAHVTSGNALFAWKAEHAFFYDFILVDLTTNTSVRQILDDPHDSFQGAEQRIPINNLPLRHAFAWSVRTRMALNDDIQFTDGLFDTGSPEPPKPKCDVPLAAPELVQSTGVRQGLPGCAQLEGEEQLRCLTHDGPTNNFCVDYVPALGLGLGWPAVPGADHYILHQFGLGKMTTINVPGASGHVDQGLQLLVPLAKTVEICGFYGYGVGVKAVDACGKEGPSALTLIAYTPARI